MPVEGFDGADKAARDQKLQDLVRTAFAEPPHRVAVAVSGGGDSMAVLLACIQSNAFDVSAVTVDHGLRSEAAEEAAFVGTFCAERGISHTTLSWEGWDRRGNLMAAARAARYRLIAEWATSQGIGHILLGHTADDQAENFLIRLARKAGPDGLAGMEPLFERHGLSWARPLLQENRAGLRDYLRDHNFSWVDDPTNEDQAFDRTRARQALKTLQEFGIGSEVLTSVGASMRATKHALTHYSRIEAKHHITEQDGDLVLSLDPDIELPAEMIRRLWRAMLSWVGGADYPPRQQQLIEIVCDLAADQRATVGGCLISRKMHVWRVTREYQAVRETVCPSAEVWDGRWRLSGPHAPDLELRALGEGIRACPDWRATEMPRSSLIATPAVWRGNELIAAPVAGFANGWTAQIVADFHSSAFAH